MSEPIRHSPLAPLHEQRGNNPPRLIGYRCEHCEALFTANGNPSNPDRIVETNRGFEGRVVHNKSHRRRARAARKS